MSGVNPAVTGAWLEYHDPGARQFIKIGDLTLESGQLLPDVVIAYQSWGKLNSAGDNAILVNHALTGWADVNGWWPQMVGSGLPFDSDRYFVVCPNVIGGCQGSTGPSSIAADGERWGSRFPLLTIRDMVAAELAFTKKIGVNKYQLSVGPSLGGMRSLEWAIDYPQLIGAICTIGSSAVATGDQIGAASIQLRAIKSDPNFNNGDYYQQSIGPIEGMGIARRIAHLTYRTESEMDVRFGRELQGDETGRYAVESYLDHQAKKLSKRFDANTYISLTEAMNSHDVGRDRGGVAAALAKIKVPIHVVSIDTDRLFPPRLQQEIKELAPDVTTLHTIASPFGHDGFLIEVESVGDVIRNTLNLQNISK
ncbi:MAG: homoserine O-acetyltransferase [Candidatus Nanopelagicaceae bacterium]|nr:homoserine O-acetyltransferase [Candidatus Nanopelagicaceae bacterium]